MQAILHRSVGFSTVAVLLLASPGCNGSSAPSETAEAQLADSTRYALHLGNAASDNRKPTLTRVIAARMTHDGRHVVVLEGFPPFVKVFTQQGALRSSFVNAGAGPGEMRQPGVIAVSGDTAILVIDGPGRAAVYDLDGRLREEVPSMGFPVLAAAPACGMDWIVYGPRFQAGSRRAQWLHRVRFEGDGHARVASTFDRFAPAWWTPR